MSAVAIKGQQQVEQAISRLLAYIHGKYPTITTEVTYDPPDRVDAWVTLHGAADAQEWDEIRQFGCEITDPAWENEGILVLIHAGDYRTPQIYPPLDQAAFEAAIEGYKSLQKTEKENGL
ncbi:MAG: hypothetical protein ACR2M0_13130 [Chloroflexia bacterium]